MVLMRQSDRQATFATRRRWEGQFAEGSIAPKIRPIGDYLDAGRRAVTGDAETVGILDEAAG